MRKKTFARKSERASSRMSYDSDSGSISVGSVFGGRAGRVYAGPLVLVRNGSRGVLPCIFVSMSVHLVVWYREIPINCTPWSPRKTE